MILGFRFQLCLLTFAVIGTSAVFVAGQGSAESQVPHERGQDVSPTFDGWVTNPDGTYSLYFGYLNRNSAEDISIPVGTENAVDGPGGPDRGQPTFFYPGRRWWIYKVVVPKDWPKDQRLTWTLKSRGRVNAAKAWLKADYEVDSVLVGMNATDRVLFSSLSEPVEKNTPPSISVAGPVRSSIKVSEMPTFAVTAADDGLPSKSTLAAPGVRFRWLVYRGPASVSFKPDTSKTPSPSPAKHETTVAFSQPGDYRLRVTASDGELFSTQDIDVTVSPGAPARPSR